MTRPTEPRAGAAGPRAVRRRADRRATPLWARLCTVFGALLLMLSVSTAGASWALSARYESNVKRTKILGDVPSSNAGDSIKGPLNLLLLGSDSRESQLGSKAEDQTRSDTIMLIHLTANLDQAYFISIPRDSYEYVPPAPGKWRGGKNKINAAFSYGGPSLMAQAVYALTKVPLDGAAVVDFESVVTMVNVVGGVTVCTPYTVRSIHTDRVWKKGCNLMYGDAAQDFMRQRYSVPGSDFGRIHNQQLVIKALAAKATTAGMLANPLKFDKLITTGTKAVTVDEGMDVRELAFALKGLRPADLNFITLPYTSDALRTPYGTAVQLDTAKCQALFAAVRNDDVATWLLANPQSVPTG